MRRFLALLLLLVPVSALAQSVISIPNSQCVWRAGNDPAWASPTLDEAGWKPYASRKLYPGQSSYWIRCRADLSGLQNTTSPAIAVNLANAYQLYFNGRLISSSGNMKTGVPEVGGRSIFPLPAGSFKAAPSLIAIHANTRLGLSAGAPNGRNLVTAGSEQDLQAYQDSLRLAGITHFLPVAICYGIIAVIALMLFGLYLSDRSRPELLLLAITCSLVAMLRLETFFSSFPWHMGATLYFSLAAAGNLLLFFYVPFFFVLAHRRMPWLYWIMVAVSSLPSLMLLAFLFLPPAVAAAWLTPLRYRFIDGLVLVDLMCAMTAPFYAFWPWWKIPRRMLLIAIFCMLWAVTDLVWFFSAILSTFGFVVARFVELSYNDLLLSRGIATTVVLVALLALFFRDQRRTARERAVLSGEMQAAQEIQRKLVPATVQTVRNIKLEVAFQPMREVGGDFYQCDILPDGAQRILLGDVSGKGAAAAMTAAVLIGASKGRKSDSPAALLQHLNQVLLESEVAGFATCLCADIARNGTLTVANAGHLSPYRNGGEIELDSGVPLGVTEDVKYLDVTVRLRPGDALTLLSDGVVEARNASGELFGFERAREISGQRAGEIAKTAQEFGQEDDITVLTLTLVSAAQA